MPVIRELQRGQLPLPFHTSLLHFLQKVWPQEVNAAPFNPTMHTQHKGSSALVGSSQESHGHEAPTHIVDEDDDEENDEKDDHNCRDSSNKLLRGTLVFLLACISS